MATPNRRSRPAPKPRSAPVAPKPATPTTEPPSPDADDLKLPSGGDDVVFEAGGHSLISNANVVETKPFDLHQLRRDFVASISDILAENTPYDQLQARLRRDGWFLQLRERMTVPHTNGGTLICFDIMIGYDAGQAISVEQISLVAPSGVADPSTWGRHNAVVPVNFAVFGRLPAAAPQADRKVEVKETPTPTPEPNNSEWEPIDLVTERRPDGLPIYYDPFSLGDPPSEIVRSLILSFEREIPEIMGLDNLAAFFTENEVVFQYLKEMDPAGSDMAIHMLNKRRDELTPTTTGRAPANTSRRPTVRH